MEGMENDNENRVGVQIAKYIEDNTFPDKYSPLYWFLRIFWSEERVQAYLSANSPTEKAKSFYDLPPRWRYPVMIIIFILVFLVALFFNKLGFITRYSG